MLFFRDLGPPGKKRHPMRWIRGLGVFAFAFIPSLTVGQVPNNTPGFELSLPSANQTSANPTVLESTARPQFAPTVDPYGVNEPISRVQGGLPAELILPPPSSASKALVRRFLKAEIDPQMPLALAVGRPKILQFKATPLRVFLPSEDVVTAEILDQQSGQELALTGLKAGSTTLTLWFEDPASPDGKAIISYLVQVYKDPLLTRPLGNLEDDINATFPNCRIELSELGGRLIVKGQAQDAIQVVQILQILAGARGASAGLTRVQNTPTVTNALNFTQQNDQLAQEEEAALRRETLDPVALARAGIVNLIRVPGEQQVMLRVTVAEVNREASRSIGLDLTSNNGKGTIFSTWTGSLNTDPIGHGSLLASIDSGQVQLAIEALRKMGLSRTLAEPNLVAINGTAANFHAGGQFPTPVLAAGGIGAGQNLQGVQFVPFGVQLRFVPLIQEREVIRLQFNAEVSVRDPSISANVGGTAVPGLNNRTVSTNVELRSGQTLAVAGILQTSFKSNSARVPFWGDLPILGGLGGVNSTSSTEQELVILVTPELVAPVDSCDIPNLPGSDTFEPTDIEFFVKNRLESRRTKDFRSPVRTDFAKLRVPDKCCPDQYLLGPVGPTDRPCNQLTCVPHTATPISTTQKPVGQTPAPIVGRANSERVVR
jgi:pilus assembly protein CpaC